jgi:general secretion pathway protein M
MIQTAHDRWRQMSQRERTMVLLGGAVVGLALVFVTAVDPFLSILDRLERQAIRKEKDLIELTKLGQAYATKRARLVEMERQMPAIDSDFSLLTFMEEAAITANVREWITGMQPHVQVLAQGYRETVVELRLEGVQFPELLDLLRAIDEAPYDVRVRHLQIRPKFNTPEYLDVTLRVLSYAKSE